MTNLDRYERRLFLLIFWFLGALVLGVGQVVGQTNNADMVLSFSTGPAEVSLGQYFKVTISVFNSTPGQATNVTVTNVLPANANFVEASASQGSVVQSSGVVS